MPLPIQIFITNWNTHLNYSNTTEKLPLLSQKQIYAITNVTNNSNTLLHSITPNFTTWKWKSIWSSSNKEYHPSSHNPKQHKIQRWLTPVFLIQHRNTALIGVVWWSVLYNRKEAWHNAYHLSQAVRLQCSLEIFHSTIIVYKTQKPKFVVVNRDNLYVLFWWIDFAGWWTDRLKLMQRNNHLWQKEEARYL